MAWIEALQELLQEEGGWDARASWSLEFLQESPVRLYFSKSRGWILSWFLQFRWGNNCNNQATCVLSVCHDDECLLSVYLSVMLVNAHNNNLSLSFWTQPVRDAPKDYGAAVSRLLAETIYWAIFKAIIHTSVYINIWPRFKNTIMLPQWKKQ